MIASCCSLMSRFVFLCSFFQYSKMILRCFNFPIIGYCVKKIKLFGYQGPRGIWQWFLKIVCECKVLLSMKQIYSERLSYLIKTPPRSWAKAFDKPTWYTVQIQSEALVQANIKNTNTYNKVHADTHKQIPARKCTIKE